MENVFDYITQEKTKYEKPIELADGWDWNMKEHLRKSFLYINSQFTEKNENRNLRPFRNKILPIINIQLRTEGFDVKDITLYASDVKNAHKSFLINKYHRKWALDNFIDTFIDDVVMNYCLYGGVLVRKTNESRPEAIDLRSLAFCNQTNILNYPFCIRHSYSFVELRKMKGWGLDENGADIDIEKLITILKKEEKNEVEIYELHGTMPVEWLQEDESEVESEKDVSQIQIVAFYQDENNQAQGVTLYKKRMPELPFKFLSRDKIANRSLGRGGVEELFEAQAWTNWNEIKKTEMANSASKTIHFSDDPKFKTSNNLSDVDNNEVLSLQEGKKIQQIDTYPRNINIFNEAIARWEEDARLLGAASEGMLGQEPSSGTPFKLYEAQNIEAKGLHKFRQGQLAVFMDEIYRDWILPHISKEIVKGDKFLTELSANELQEVADKTVENKANSLIKKKILSGQIVFKDEVDLLKKTIRETVLKKGTKRFVEILKDEMKDINISVSTNIANKQKNLGLLTDKLVNIMRQYIATPEIRADKGMNDLLNTILESSGLSPITFSPPPMAQQQQQLPQKAQQPQPQLTN